MRNKKADIIFLGYDEAAISSLLKCDVNILAVIYEETQKKNYTCKFDEIIRKNGGNIYTIPKNDRQELTRILKTLKKPDLFVISCFIILSKDIMDIPNHGIINIHPSLLPHYRGPYPIEWALVNGEKKTGVTFMSIDSGIDTGGIYRKFEIEIKDDDNALTVKKKINRVVEENLSEIIKGVLDKTIKVTPQPQGGSYFPRRDYHGRFADFKLMHAKDIHNLVRSQISHGGMITAYNFQRIAFYLSKLLNDSSEAIDGGEILQVNFDKKNGYSVVVQCVKGKVELYSKEEAAKTLKIGDRLGT